MSGPNIKSLDWDAFRVILAIDREGSLSSAARTLGVSQATVGRHLKRAEEALNAKLFHRLSNGLFSTEPGKIAVEYAEKIEAEVSSANMRLSGANDEEGGVIRLSVPLNAMPHGLSSDIQAFMEEHPTVRFEIEASDQPANFLSRDVDAVVRADNNPTSGLWGYRLADIHYSFYGSKEFLETWRPQLEARPCTVPVPVIVLSNSEPSADRDVILGRYPGGRIVAECNGLDSLIPLVRDGLGLGRIARFMAPSYPELEMVLQCSEQHARSLWVLTHPDYRDTRRIRLFMEFVRDRFAARAEKFV